jgi:hypothetical protein
MKVLFVSGSLRLFLGAFSDGLCYAGMLVSHPALDVKRRFLIILSFVLVVAEISCSFLNIFISIR